ncbi:hypothetical protein LJC68_07400 [Bacteroidales bacterium OttesenSCG-928-B11]|nr:hypothetical protein [Bacteroidales bacterium OttesenSCG-928-B11]
MKTFIYALLIIIGIIACIFILPFLAVLIEIIGSILIAVLFIGGIIGVIIQGIREN